MAVQKPSIPKGMRDFSAQQLAKRNYIFDTIRKVFVKYSFEPIETPTMEKLSTLTGKYGNEGDQLLFKVLNSGDFLRKAKDKEDYKVMTPQISEKGLRYDLTVPFARYVVMHQNEITFPFKRYQIQPVWRADRPQKGRYREFYQCDADVVGSDSLINESELIQIYDEVFAKLNINTTIKLNNRKILAGMAEAAGIPDKMIDMTVAIDKLDKVGIEGVRKEMRTRGIDDSAIEIIEGILAIDNLTDLKSVFEISELLKKYNDTLDFSERRSGLNASCTEGDFCLSVKYSPIYNNVFMVNIYERIENDGGSNDLSENKVQYLFSFGRYGDIQGWTLIKATSNKK